MCGTYRTINVIHSRDSNSKGVAMSGPLFFIAIGYFLNPWPGGLAILAACAAFMAFDEHIPVWWQRSKAHALGMIGVRFGTFFALGAACLYLGAWVKTLTA